MRQVRQLSFLLVLSALLAGCPTPVRTVSVHDAANYQGAGFNNILVIGKAEDYDGRARFERELVSQLTAIGAKAKAYYLAVGGNKPIDRKTIEELVKTEKFDAVLITRVLNLDAEPTVKVGSAATKTVRKDEGALHLFRYDYEELNEPMTLNIEVSIDLSSELFDTSDGELIWAIETRVSNKDMVSKIIDEVVAQIVQELKKNRLVGN